MPGDVGLPFGQDGAVFQNAVGVGLRRGGRAAQFHIGLVGRAARLVQVAALASGDHIVPGVGAVVAARDDVVQGQALGFDAAVLAGVVVAPEHLLFGQAARRKGALDQIDQSDDGRGVQGGAVGADARRFGALFQQFGLALGQQDDGAADGANIHRHIVEVEHQHRGGKPSGYWGAGGALRRGQQ